MLGYMKRDNWLLHYGKIEGIHQALTGMSRRTKFESGMEIASKALEKDYEHYQQEFVSFFPDLKSKCDKFLVETKDA